MTAPAHDLALFARLRALAFSVSPDCREGRMFGCPAIHVGRCMAACVLGDAVGLRVPEPVAEAARAGGRARHFTPYGKQPMREWIALRGGPDSLDQAADLIRAALLFAVENNARKSRA